MADIRNRMLLDSKDFNKSLKDSQGQAKGFQGVISKIGPAVAGAFAIGAIMKAAGAVKRFAMEVITLGSTVSDMSTQIGISVTEFEALGLAARNAGAEDNHLVNALTKLRAEMGKAIRGEETSIKKFEQMGIAVDDLVRLNPAQIFEKMGQSMGSSNDDATKFAAVVDLIGQRNAPRLIEVLQTLSSKTLVDLQTESANAWQSMGDHSAKQLDRAADAIQRFQRSVKVVGAIILTSLIDVWDKLTTSPIERQQKAIEATRRKAESVRQQALAKEAADAQRITKAQEGLADKQAKAAADRQKKELDSLSNAEKLAKLQAKEAKINEEIQKLQKGSVDEQLEAISKEEELLGITEERRDVEAAIVEEREKAAEAAEKLKYDSAKNELSGLKDKFQTHGNTGVDSATRIGGGGWGNLFALGKEKDVQTDLLRKQNDILRKLPDSIASKLRVEMGLR